MSHSQTSCGQFKFRLRLVLFEWRLSLTSLVCWLHFIFILFYRSMCLQQQPKKSIFQFSYVPQLIFSFALLTALHINQYSVGQFLISMLFRYFLPNVYLIDWSKTLSTPNTCLDSFYIVSSPVIHIQCNRFVSTISAPFT